MNVTMLLFVGAAALAFILYYAFPLKIRWTVLLAVSLLFYAAVDTYLITFVVVTAVGVYLSARSKGRRNAAGGGSFRGAKKA